MTSASTNPPGWPPGHFYSPIPSLAEVIAEESRIFEVPPSIPGIDLRGLEQVELVDNLIPHCDDHPFSEEPDPSLRYHFANPFFSFGDGLMLHGLLRHLAPRQLIEVGSGHSSALILDTNEHYLGNRIQTTFIEPHPERLNELLRTGDREVATIIAARAQEADLELFNRLEAGDVLFIDSSHVCKVGSDVNLLILHVLPRLARGVVVHFHDIFYPFEYPKSWLLEGRFWTEAYLLRAFLSMNPGFRILLWNSYLAHFHSAAIAAKMPLWSRNPGGSIWIERL